MSPTRIARRSDARARIFPTVSAERPSAHDALRELPDARALPLETLYTSPAVAALEKGGWCKGGV